MPYDDVLSLVLKSKMTVCVLLQFKQLNAAVVSIRDHENVISGQAPLRGIENLTRLPAEVQIATQKQAVLTKQNHTVVILINQKDAALAIGLD